MTRVTRGWGLMRPQGVEPWRWWAFDGASTRQGSCVTEHEALLRAQIALHELARPRVYTDEQLDVWRDEADQRVMDEDEALDRVDREEEKS